MFKSRVLFGRCSVLLAAGACRSLSKLALCLAILSGSWSASAAGGSVANEGSYPEKQKRQPAQVLRVGGDYTVAAISRIDERSFKVEFRAVRPTGKFDVLNLECDHVNVGVKVGQQIRLSAEVLRSEGSIADVSQMVIFLPNSQGNVPVWLLSNKIPPRGLGPSRYLEMHSPTTDYLVM